MTWIVYDQTTSNIVKECETEKAAKNNATRLNNKDLDNDGCRRRYVVKTKEWFDRRGEKITVINLMSGKPVEIDWDTPWHLRPDSESYWSA